jgi:hypothetical protein
LSTDEIKDLKKSLAATNWTGLTGGGAKRGEDHRREYLPDLYLDRNKAALRVKIEHALAPYIAYVQRQYPGLTAVKVGAIRTKPHTVSQFEGLGNRLHSDYADESSLEYAPELRPVSILVGLDGFEFMYLPTRDLHRSQIKTIKVESREMVYFTHECLHAGGENSTDDTVYRLFAYVCSSPNDWPVNRVFCKGWTAEADPCLVIEEERKASAEEGEPSRDVTTTLRGRISRKPKA